ncbi:peptidase [Silvanigrella aquatica]|uniref:Uncharacterized protein n=1 Tax=Silvanigrella aquatica TaxID=1915309 RepID=A0A1L4D1J8_9BACT|nr:peptidase [Silvanigrella aquatica]APJ04067.1 hypothetical protein AXG55_09170 [Silvanigrella aquatica]
MFKKVFLRKIPIAIALGIASTAQAENEINLEQFLIDFYSNPIETMNKIPPKSQIYRSQSNSPQFSQEEITSQNFIEKKDKIRSKIIRNGNKSKKRISPYSAYLGNDNPQNLIDKPENFIDNIYVIDSKNIASARLNFQPWSGSYWPLSEASIASRYTDLNRPKNDVNKYSEYILQQFPAENLVSEGKTNSLSPAEKYDLLMNDKNYTLTNSILSEVKNYGKFEGWEGICHGWAPAAYMYKRPIRSVSVANAEGKSITFYPADIKALTSLLWANLSYTSKFVGGRCNEKNPARDANGRIQSQDCFDTNPGSFHLALVNQIGINKKSFVFDATYDFQVWNQPLVSYSYYYFNPQTGQASSKSSDVMIKASDFKRDPFKSYRSQNSSFIVGVKTKVEYIGETWQDASTRDNPSRDSVVAVEYIYDLEIDTSGKIIGGEWYQTAHPDFMWTPTSNSDITTNLVPSPTNYNYEYIFKYHNYMWNENPTRPVSEWTYYSAYAAKQRRVPLENIIRNLTAWASMEHGGEAPENCKQPCVPSIYKWHNYE